MAEQDKELKEKYGKILRANGIQDEIQTIEVVVPKSTGDNFMSTCAAVTINFENSKRPPLELFVKNTIQNKDYCNLTETMQMFERESYFFNEILPPLRNFCLQKVGHSDYLDFIFPKCFYADEKFVVLENLVKMDYIMVDKTTWHDFSHTRKVFELLAKMHGVSYAFIEEMGKQNFIEKHPVTKISNLWSNMGASWMMPFLKGFIDPCVRTLEKHPVKGSEKALEYLTECQLNGFKRTCDLYDLDKTKSCDLVINHGDIWSCNLLFRQNPQTKEATDTILIDLQTVHLGSPALDLMYYMYMSVDTKVRRERFNELLEIYWTQFNQVVESLQSKVKFSFEELLHDYRTKCEPGLIFELYLSVFGWDSFSGLGDLEKFEGDFGDHFVQTLDTKANQLSEGKGEQFALQIVEIFQEYEKFTKGN